MNMNENQLQKYETYVNDVLKSDLNNVCRELDGVVNDLAEYQSLKETINTMLKRKAEDKSYKFTSDIGANFFTEVVVDDLSNILLEIGLGYYLDFTLTDAVKFVEARVKFLNSKLNALRDKSSSIKAHIKLLLLYCQHYYPAVDIAKKSN